MATPELSMTRNHFHTTHRSNHHELSNASPPSVYAIQRPQTTQNAGAHLSHSPPPPILKNLSREKSLKMYAAIN